MRKYLLIAAVATAAIAAPAAARDGTGYIGVDGGVMFPKSQNLDGTVDFTTGTDIARTRFATIRHKAGWDVDLNGGYDFGMFRLEAELGYKRAKLKNLRVNDAFLTAFNAGAGTTYTAADFDTRLNGHTSVLSGMINGLVDFGADNGVSGFVGAGVGRARVKELGARDSAWAWQLLAGVRTAVSENIDLGLKYRYFRTGRLNFADQFAFNGGTGSGGVAMFDSRSHFASHSLLASLSYNFGAPAAPPPPPPPPPPPVEVAPATQTCPDGSVILATSSCPLPPPPPPPPPPVERGERGE